MLMTSATLSTSSYGPAGFSAEIGLSRDDVAIHTDLCGTFEPRSFGSLEFTFADPRAPTPFLRGTELDEAEYNPAWVDYARRLIERVAASGRTLVLCQSYRDVALMEDALSVARDRVFAQRRSLESRRNCQAAFERSAAGIWLSPTAWEGLDMPGMIDQLVILRLPFASMRDESLISMHDMAVRDGVSIADARRAVQSKMHRDAVRRIRQALGRPIRSPSDSAHVVFCDPRMTLPTNLRDQWIDAGFDCGSSKHRGLGWVIPRRFRRAADSAHIFTVENTLWNPLLVTSN